jgi:hypothetical protein
MPNPEETSKVDAHTKDVPLESAAPFGHQEIESQMAKEALGDGAADRPVQSGSKGRKEPPDTARNKPKANPQFTPRLTANKKKDRLFRGRP